MELVADYATPVPAAAMFAMVGIPEDVTVRNTVMGWVTQMVAAHDRTQPLMVQAAGATSRMALQVYLQGLLVQYEREGNGPGLLGHLARHRRNLTAEDVYQSCVDFVLAGSLSTTWLVASAMHRLRPDQIDALRRDRSRVPRVLEEVLRLEPPVQLIDRFVTEDDVTLGAARLSRGDKVTAVIGSANRDPRRFDVPDDLDLAGDDNGHLSFGDGIHRCIGEPLAMAVAPIMLDELLEFDDLEVDGYAQWQADPYLRGLVNLPVRI